MSLWDETYVVVMRRRRDAGGNGARGYSYFTFVGQVPSRVTEMREGEGRNITIHERTRASWLSSC